MTSAELLDLFLTTLTRRFGGNRRRWRMVVGPAKLYPLSTHPHCNWSVAPSGSARENEAVEAVADDLRAVHPVVSG